MSTYKALIQPNNSMAHNQQSTIHQKHNMDGVVSDNILWVGKRNIGISNDIFVYDSEMNSVSSGTIYLFSIRLNSMQQFQKDRLREYFSKVSDPVTNKMAIEKYINWKTEHGNEFTKIHPTSEQKLQIAAERHKEYINKIQKTYLGFSKSTNDIHQRTVCFSCRELPDNRIGIDIKCNACGWIICNRCGACGCGYVQIVAERHKEYIDKIQKIYLGFSKSTNEIHRTTNCFSCSELLDNSIDIECNACGWIICNRCGACGCGYDPSKRGGFY